MYMFSGVIRGALDAAAAVAAVVRLFPRQIASTREGRPEERPWR
jgi:hypothetical protein